MLRTEHTRSIPQINTQHPLWDAPELLQEMHAGRYFLPGTITGKRETLITSPVRALPRHVLARFWGGRLQPQARATRYNTWLMWLGVTAQGLSGTAAIQLLARWF